MALVSKSEPIGIDIPVDRIQRALYTQLVTNGPWQEYESYHRAYQNETENGLRPEVFTSNNDYKEVFMDDTFNVTSFFITDQTRDIQVETEFRSEVSIIFQVQLSKLLTLVPHRADEEFNNQVSNVLRDLGDGIEYLGLEQGISNVFSEFDQEEIQWDDMQPYYVVRFNLSVPYSYDCSRTFAGTICTVGVTASGNDPTTEGGSDGDATATPTGVQGIVSYLWTTSDGSIPSGQETNQTATGLTAGTYSVLVTDSIKSGCTETDSVTLDDGDSFSMGNALTFDRVNDFVLVTGTINTSTVWSAHFWFYANAGSFFGRPLGDNLTYINWRDGSIGVDVGGPQVIFDFDNSVLYDAQGSCLVTSDGTDIRVYVNGVESTTGAITESTAGMGIERIGSHTGSSNFWDGELNELIWELGFTATPANAVTLYNGGAGIDPTSIFLSPKRYYKMNGTGSDATAIDEVAGNDGTLTNFSFSPSPWNAW